jgi:CHAD domain-containing protein
VTIRRVGNPAGMANANKHTLPAAAGAVAAGGALAAGKLVRDRAVKRADVRRARAYRLQPGEGAGEGVRRIARGQIDLAREGLEGRGDIGESVHEARKAFKRVRALVRLARVPLGDEAYRRENVAFRDAGRKLAGVRDATVMAQTLDDVVARHRDELPEGAFAGLRDALSAEADAAHERIEDDRAAVDDVLAGLEHARARVAAWPLPDGGDAAILAPGFERIYRRGRRALRAAREEPGTERLHELRKRAKDLWHAAQVMRPVAPKRMKRLARRAHDLSDVVGEDHDLAVLLDAARERSQALAPGERELLTVLVGRRRAELQQRALETGRQVYARKPRKLAKAVSRAASR